jgi:hypothetical protein
VAQPDGAVRGVGPYRAAPTAAIYRPDGGLLVRSQDGGRVVLTLLSPAGTVAAQVTEPALTRDLFLVRYAG